MAGIGPPPKRSDQRVRRNKDVIEIDKIAMHGEVEVPELGLDDPHPMIQDFWDSLTESGQTKYYEPTDWQFARWTLYWANDLIKTRKDKVSAVMLQTINAAFSDLLVTEAERRRVRMEIERQNQQEATVTELKVSDRFRERFAQ